MTKRKTFVTERCYTEKVRLRQREQTTSYEVNNVRQHHSGIESTGMWPLSK